MIEISKWPKMDLPIHKVADQSTTVTLNWQDTNGIPQEKKVKIRIKTNGGIYAYFALAAGTVQFDKSGLAEGKAYFWSVQAKGNAISTKDSAFPADHKFTTAR